MARPEPISRSTRAGTSQHGFQEPRWLSFYGLAAITPPELGVLATEAKLQYLAAIFLNSRIFQHVF
jgi:hypothetical protein